MTKTRPDAVSMKKQDMEIKLSYIAGLRPVVFQELKKLDVRIRGEHKHSVYLEYSEDVFAKIPHMKSVARSYVTARNAKYHPSYISNHKSLLGDLIRLVVEGAPYTFSSFTMNCAGSDSPEVRSIAHYIQETHRLIESDNADLKIHIIKLEDLWEIGVQITPRPLSVRDYRVMNMRGAMNPTIAYAVNSFCRLEESLSYLNIFSGSATLLIEAGQCYPNLQKLIGFDNDKSHLSLSMRNVKSAGLIKRIQVREGSMFDKPDFGIFDAIASDLPFGMSSAKDENLEDLYKAFLEYCEEKLNPHGRLVMYTNAFEIIESLLRDSRFKIVQSLQITFITNVNAYLKPKILVCEFRG
jgi:tRNA G10  N-methylase Trm11